MRDIRQKNWFWIENALIDRKDLTFEEKAMYMILARFTDTDGKCFPSIEKLAELIGKDKRTVIRYTKKLEEKGLIEKKRRFNQTNMYYLKNVTSDSDKNDSDTDVLSQGDINVTSDSDTDVILKKPIEKNSIKKTQLKEKNKKEKTDHTEKLLAYIEDLKIDTKKKEIFKEWIEYKKTKGQYKDTKSLDVLIRRFIKYSVKDLRDIVERSIMNNYAGIFEPKENQGGKNGSGKQNSRQIQDKHTEEPDYKNSFKDWN